MSIYPQLDDRSWLLKRYVEDGSSLIEIGDEIGCNRSLVRKYLLRYGVRIRTTRESALLRREDDGFICDRPVLDGCLLGDASLISNRKTDEGCPPYFSKQNVHRDHVEFVSSALFSGRIDRVRDCSGPNPLCKSGFSERHRVTSLTHDCLLPIFREWYPPSNGYNKCIPPSVTVDPRSLLHWFMDDGTSRVIECKRGRRVVLYFCTESFSMDDQEMLCEKINRCYDLRASTTPYNAGTGYRIWVPRTKAEEFFEIIGPPPVESMAPKWRLLGQTWKRAVPGHKLSPDDVIEIKQALRERYTRADLARQFGVDPKTISDIKSGATWSHITLDERGH